MRIAFYAPLKSPDSSVPSGDRLIARMLVQALETGGHSVEIASRLRSFDRLGDLRPGVTDSSVWMLAPSRQQRVKALADRIAQRLKRRWMARPAAQRPQLWFTYHLYHKAPDWIGPQVAAAFDIPYVVAEASVTPKQAGGPWAFGHRGVLEALGAAAMVVALNPKDEAGVRTGLKPDVPILPLQPFIDTAPFAAAAHSRPELRMALAGKLALDPNVPWLVTVAMMRADVKRDSYRLLADAADRLQGRPWQLIVIGDGVAAPEVRSYFAAFRDRVRFVGQQSRELVAEMLAACDLFVWPAIGEAIGMVFLEAQAAGLPVIGANRPGVAGVVLHGQTGLLVAEGDAAAFSSAIAELLDDPIQRRELAANASRTVFRDHELTVASQRLNEALLELIQ